MRAVARALAACCAAMLAGCASGPEPIVYSQATPAGEMRVPAGTGQKQISVQITIVTIDEGFADRHGLVGGFGHSAGSLLTESQRQKLLEYVRGSKKAHILASTGVVLLNGVPGSVSLLDEHRYISDYRLRAGGQYEPVVSTVHSGIQTDLKAIAGTGGRIVGLKIGARLSELKELRDVPAANIPSAERITVQYPEMEVVEMLTATAIPPGHTLALMQPCTLQGRKRLVLLLARPEILE